MNPFDQLINRPRARLLKTPSVSVVVDGRRIKDARQINAEDRRSYKRKLLAAKAAAAYQRQRLDPAKMAKRRAWYEANKAKVLAYKKRWDESNLEKLRAQKLDWAKRAYQADPDKYRQRARDYYQKNRERILAGLAAKAAAKKAAGACNG